MDVDIAPPVPVYTNQSSLQQAVRQSVKRYIESLNGVEPENLHQIVLDEIEAPLFETILQYTGGRQVHTARMLGIARGTLRKKLKRFGLISREPLTQEQTNASSDVNGVSDADDSITTE